MHSKQPLLALFDALALPHKTPTDGANRKCGFPMLRSCSYVHDVDERDATVHKIAVGSKLFLLPCLIIIQLGILQYCPSTVPFGTPGICSEIIELS